MKRFKLLISLCLFSSYLFTQDSIVPVLNEMFPAHELKSDLTFIKNKAVYKKYNCSGLLFVGKEKFYSLYDSIEKVIDEKGGMSRLDFYLLTAPLVQSLQDDRSFYSLLGDYAYDSQNKEYLPFLERFIFPFGVDIFNDTVIVISDSSNLSKSQLISINDIPANKIVSEVFKYTSFRRDRYYKKNRCGSLGFYQYPILLNILFSFQNEVKIKYSPFGSNNILTKQIQLLPIGDSSFLNHVKPKNDSKSWYSVKNKNDFAILTIKSLPETDINLQTINDIFKRIHNINPKALIIDISYCNWSSDSFWISILNYLYKGEIWLYEYHKEPQVLSKYSKKRLKNSDYIVGNYSDINKEYMFEGKIYLITGPLTTSSATRFADILQFNNIVDKTFGCETLTKTTQYDYSANYYLPITGLRLLLSTNLYYALDKNLNTHGLIPDIEVKPNTVLDFLGNRSNRFVIDKVIKLIESENIIDENTTY